jgi:LysM repeat protein
MDQDRKGGGTMLQNRWSRLFIHLFVVVGLIFTFWGCAKQTSESVQVDKKQVAEQEMAAQKQSATGMSDVKASGDQTSAMSSTEMTASATQKQTAGRKVKSADKKSTLLSSYVVKKGDSLWWIARYKDVYNDHFLWPLIYDANKELFKDPNKIYPGQKLMIPRDGFKMEDIRKARKKAGARKPYNPPARAVPPVS